MSADAKAPDQAAETPRKPKKGALRWILLVIILVFALGGAAGAFYWWRGGEAQSATESGDARAKGAAPESAGEPGVLTFEPFVVNLADPGGQHFLKATLRIVVGSSEAATEIEKDEVRMLRVRSALLELLSQQSAEQLVTPDGKAALKRAIADRVNPVLDSTKVSDVLFAEFVVQF